MPGDQAMTEEEDAIGDQEGLRRLAGEDHQDLRQQGLIKFVQGGFEIERADDLGGTIDLIGDGNLALEGRITLPLAGDHHQGIRGLAGLAHLHRPHIRQAQNAVDLQLQLGAIEMPQTVADAVEIRAPDLVQAPLNDANAAFIVEIELQSGKRQGHHGTEDQHAEQQPPPDTGTKDAEAGRRWLAGRWRFDVC